ncbi:MAG: xanthine dehydrogenase family protein molybdopterin-binding subunit [Candidatus Caldarchaeum sp.]|nr:xanthine dehydrogenase family protein molybdopterin-binding subunit [Candidatus Caldarchaeum sp.]
MNYVGAAVPKKDAGVLVRGLGRFIEDIKLANMLYGGFVRSPYAHAVVNKIDAGDALRMRDVVAVWSLNDIKPFINPYPAPVGRFAGLDVKHAELYPLAGDRVRFVGEPVAFVVCRDIYAVEDAVERVVVDYTPLKPLVDPMEALNEKENLLYPEWGDNILMRYTIESGDVEKAFREADTVLETRIETQRFTGTPIECRGYVAQFDPLSNGLTLYASTQQPHPLRTILSELLNIPESVIRVIQPQVGGAFGLKIPPYREEPVISLAALKLRTAVKWVENRSEHMVATGHSKHQIHDIQVAVKRDGQVLGLKDRIVVDLGVYNATRGIMQAYNAAKMLPGPYKIRNLRVEGYGVVTNKTHYQAYRGFGKDSAAIVYERVMDLVANELNMDKIEVRLRNLIRQDEMPYVTATGAEYDSGNYEEVVSILKGWLNRLKMVEKEGPILRGVGVALAVEPCASAFFDSFTQATDTTTIQIDQSGKITVKTGVTTPGNGNETSIAQVVADKLGVRVEDIHVIQGDTAVCPYGIGNNSSRVSVVGVSSAYLAAEEMRRKITQAASSILECNPSDIEIENGVVQVKGSPDKKLTLKEVARYVYRRTFTLPSGVGPVLEATASFRAPNINWVKDARNRLNTYVAYSFAAFGVIVELDQETGRLTFPHAFVVDDCGKVINPALVDGQVVGGLVQGLGGALYEQLVYDSEGNIVTGSLMDYLIPTALEAPREVEVEHYETPSPHTPVGSKGVGETGMMVVPALISAAEDALRKLGTRANLSNTPLTPEKLLRAAKKLKT